MTHSAENDPPGCAEEACRAWAIRIGENPDTISCYLCRPSVIPPEEGDPYDEDGYCEFCGNGRWKYHAPWCKWQDAMERVSPPEVGQT